MAVAEHIQLDVSFDGDKKIATVRALFLKSDDQHSAEFRVDYEVKASGMSKQTIQQNSETFLVSGTERAWALNVEDLIYYRGFTMTLAPRATVTVWNDFGFSSSTSVEIPQVRAHLPMAGVTLAGPDDIKPVDKVRWLATWSTLTGVERAKIIILALLVVAYFGAAARVLERAHVRNLLQVLFAGAAIVVGGCGRAIRRLLSSQIQVVFTKPDVGKEVVRVGDVVRFRSRVPLDEAGVKIIVLNYEKHIFDRNVRQGFGEAVVLFDKTLRNIQPQEWQNLKDEIHWAAALASLPPPFKLGDGLAVVDRRVQVQVIAPGYPPQIYTSESIDKFD